MYDSQLNSVLAHLDLCRERDVLARLLPEATTDRDLWDAVIREAARFGEHVLAPLNLVLDRHGCELVDGQVRLHPDQRAAWDAFARNGWMSLTVPEAYGGQGMPMLLLAAVHEFFERGSIAFCMIPGGTRAACRLIEAHAGEAVRAEWLPQLAAGGWTATICISEAEAGSDVGRARTRAVCGEDGRWRVTGEKMWISFGNHDAAARIGHMVLARSEPDVAGVRGLSLFLVPSTRDADGLVTGNGVVCRRIEEKIGLHGSPTCALGFEDAVAELIGERGKGLQQLFRMITAMRLSVGVQGIGVAAGALAVAKAYAAERRQGGAATCPPLAIERHPDVRLALLEMEAVVETHRGLTYAASALADIADVAVAAEAATDAGLLLQWLLPLVKTGGGELAFDIATRAVQVLGGAGLTREWPVEQALRDARALTIYEGTTGIQAIDLLRRRALGKEPHFEVFERTVRSEIAMDDSADAERLANAVDQLAEAVRWMRSSERSEEDRDCGAVAFLHLALDVARGWIALRLTLSDVPELAMVGRYWLKTLNSRVATSATMATIGAQVLV